MTHGSSPEEMGFLSGLEDPASLDGMALVHRGRHIIAHITIRYCETHEQYTLRFNDEEVIGHADTADDARALGDAFLDGFLRGLEADLADDPDDPDDAQNHVHFFDRVQVTVLAQTEHLEDRRN